MTNFSICDRDPTNPAWIEVDNVAGTVGIEARWERVARPLQTGDLVYVNLKRDDALLLAHAILSAALEC